MREATYEDAIAVGQQLNLNKEEVWKILKGVKYSSKVELSLAVHHAFRVKSAGSDVEQPTRKN